MGGNLVDFKGSSQEWRDIGISVKNHKDVTLQYSRKP